jgi:peroxiredoxin Q/BCP
MKTTQTPPYKAPDFSLKDEAGNDHTLSDYHGSWLVLYFYPKDDTPGCTTQACSLRDSRDDLTELGAKVVGVSQDEATAHEKFKAKYNLNFTLLTDSDGEVLRSYGAWGAKQFGREGILRKTFIIDPEGIVRKVYGRAVPIGHGEKVLADLRAIQSA